MVRFEIFRHQKNMYNLQFSCELESCCFDENSKSTDKFIKSIIVWSGSFFFQKPRRIVNTKGFLIFTKSFENLD